MDIQIRSAGNGVILKIQATADEAAEEIVYQEIEDDEVAAFAEFLRFVLDHYGPTTSRYSAKRIRIVVEPGDKYQDGRDD